MKALLALAVLLMASALTGCAAHDAIFVKPATWPGGDCGTKTECIALAVYRDTHGPIGMRPHTSIGSKSLLVHNREATKSCVDGTVYAAQRAAANNLPYEVILFKKTEGLFHSVVKIGDEVIDTRFGQPYPYADFLHEYGEPHGNYGMVKPSKIKTLFTMLGGTFK